MKRASGEKKRAREARKESSESQGFNGEGTGREILHFSRSQFPSRPHPRWSPGPGCMKPPFKCSHKWITYESAVGTLSGVT